jgi:transposase
VAAPRTQKPRSKKRAAIADSHDCAWKVSATELAAQLKAQTIKFDAAAVQLAAQERRLAELERMFARKSEKLRPMRPIRKPARTQEQIQGTRDEREKERAENTEVVVTNVTVPEADKTCTHCNDTAFRAVGEGKASETLHFVNAHFRKQITRRETCVCRCGKTLVTAEAPERWSEKTQYASSFVAYLVTQKCMASMPFYRLESMFSHIGIPVARSTMNELFYRAATKLEPLRNVLFEAIREDFLVQIDETSFKLSTQKTKAFMWAFVGERLTGYVFDLTRAGKVATAQLGASKGASVTDDYAGYNALEALGGRVRCGCMAHARRGFFEAGAVLEAETALALIAHLYRVEHQADNANVLGTEAHLAMRLDESRKIFTLLLKLSRTVKKKHGPKTLLGKAAHYLCSNVRTLKQFLFDVRIPLDNNRAENALRTIAVGRKNYLFVHSEEAGKALALLYSLTTSCARIGVNPLTYLDDVLDRIDDTLVADLRNLLPDRWTLRTQDRAPLTAAP